MTGTRAASAAAVRGPLAPATIDEQYADLGRPGGVGYAYWAGRLAVAVEFALNGTPGDRRVARETLAAYRHALDLLDDRHGAEATT